MNQCKVCYKKLNFDHRGVNSGYCFKHLAFFKREQLEAIYAKNKGNPITLQNCLLILDSCHVYGPGSVYAGRRHLKLEESAKILAPFGFKNKPTSTKEMRSIVLEYVLKNHILLLNIVNFCVEKHFRKITSTRIVITKCSKWFLECLKKLAVIYYCSGKTTEIKYGTFFINNKWIHVG